MCNDIACIIVLYVHFRALLPESWRPDEDFLPDVSIMDHKFFSFLFRCYMFFMYL